MTSKLAADQSMWPYAGARLLWRPTITSESWLRSAAPSP